MYPLVGYVCPMSGTLSLPDPSQKDLFVCFSRSPMGIFDALWLVGIEDPH